MNKIFVSLLFIFIGFTTFSQKRIGLDFSTRMMDINTTFHYQEVLKNRLLWSIGAFHGGMGKNDINGDTLNIHSGSRGNYSPYANVNEPFIDPSGEYALYDYKTKVKGTGVQFGLGYFIAFGPTHGIRTNVNFRLGYATVKTHATYARSYFSKVLFQTHENNHFFGGVSTELYHTIRHNKRFTFFYGLKVPYHFTVDKARFDPLKKADLLNGFEPEITIGITRNIGKCD
ncbi:MAG: hypothetical protein ACI837_000612 [Crocinitomicaceae bacterium]|jgi:hypothetical protein